jgi:hypothetical protein
MGEADGQRAGGLLGCKQTERKDDQRAGERSTKTMSLHPTATPPVPEERARTARFPTDHTTMKHC